MSKPVEPSQVVEVLAPFGYGDAVVQTSANNGIIIRMKELKEGSDAKANMVTALQAKFGTFKELELQSVGPTLGVEIRNRAVVAIVLASIGVLAYIAYAFRNTQNPFLYGVAAIIAMIHDVLILIGIFSILAGSRESRSIRSSSLQYSRSSASRSTTRLWCSTASARIWPASRAHVRRSGELQRRPNTRSLAEHVAHRRLHAHRALSLRRPVDALVCLRAPDRNRQRNLLFDLQREPGSGRLGESRTSSLYRATARWTAATGHHVA